MSFFIQGPYFCLSLTSVCLLQLRDVTKGLIYMHDQGIIHGDLKGVRFQTPCNPPMPNLPALRRISWSTTTIVPVWQTSVHSR